MVTSNSRETSKLGEKIANNLRGKRIIALYGDLGSGKTTFVQGLAKGLGIRKRIISPTFVIIHQYKILPHLGARCNAFYHIDLYRIENERGLEGLGLEEIINDPQNIVAIEWAQKFKNLLPKDRIDIYFEYLDENKRRIWIKR